MDAALPTARRERPEKRPALTPGRFSEIVWASAWEALWATFLLQLLGGIALGMLGGIFGKMTPSWPPGLAGKPQPEAVPSPVWDAFRSGFGRHKFVILFVVVLVVQIASRVVRYSRVTKHRRAAAWLLRASRRIGDDWFSALVGNAFTAMVAAIILHWSQAFSVVGWLCGLIFDLLRPLTHSIADALPGQGLFNAIASLYSWYGDNQFKFTFWLLYSAGICDDLGLPNYKTLSRWLWRKLRRRFSSQPEQPLMPSPR
jgi:hypothetical protein